jgi:two-component system, cell cycle sensor histidine kinase and response regulator CckA
MLAYSGQAQFVLEAVNLNELIGEMTQMLEVSISKKAVLSCKFDPDLPAVEADATQIRQVIMNLVINASEAIGEHSGAISITTGVAECDRATLADSWVDNQLPEGRYVFVDIVDTGCGMNPDTIPRIFDPFFSTKFTGRGLGLAAVLGIVRGHNGAIKVQSEPGLGTSIRVLFPASSQSAAARPEDVVVGAPWRGKGIVLLVDDEETVRAVGKAMLVRLGFEVLMAADGQEALEIFGARAREIACVILDLTMPRMDGAETLAALRRIRDDVPVIVSSGYDEQDVAQRFADKGMTGFIQKPYELKGLEAKLKLAFGA